MFGSIFKRAIVLFDGVQWSEHTLEYNLTFNSKNIVQFESESRSAHWKKNQKSDTKFFYKKCTEWQRTIKLSSRTDILTNFQGHHLMTSRKQRHFFAINKTPNPTFSCMTSRKIMSISVALIGVKLFNFHYTVGIEIQDIQNPYILVSGIQMVNYIIDLKRRILISWCQMNNKKRTLNKMLCDNKDNCHSWNLIRICRRRV